VNSERNYSENYFAALTFLCYGAKNSIATFFLFNDKRFTHFVMFLFGEIVHGTDVMKTGYWLLSFQ